MIVASHPGLREKLRPGEIVPIEIEIWLTSVVVEPGERLVLEVGAKDDPLSSFQHDAPRGRARTGTNTIHTGGTVDSHLLLPIIPGRSSVTFHVRGRHSAGDRPPRASLLDGIAEGPLG